MIEIEDILRFSKVDICTVSETHLKRNSLQFRFEIDGFHFFRNDREVKGGGGTGIYCAKALKPREVAKSAPGSCIEYIFIEFCSSQGKILVGAFYNAPPSNNKISEIEGVLTNLTPLYDKIIFCGDFNINLMKSSAEKRRLLSILEGFSLQYLKFNATCHSPIASESSLLDYVVVNDSSLVKVHGQVPVPSISEHDLLFVSLNIRTVVNNKEKITVKDFKNVNQTYLTQNALLLDWNAIYSNPDISQKIQILNLNMKYAETHFIPNKKINPKSKNCWYNDRVRLAEAESVRAYNLWLRTRSTDDRRVFCKLRNKVTSMKRCYQEHSFTRRFSDLRNDPKRFHGLFRDLWQGGNEPIPEKFLESLDDLNDHFCTVEQTTCAFPFADSDCEMDDQFEFRCVSEVEVMQALAKIRSGTAGIDGISLNLIKLLLPVIFPFMLHIFNYILTSMQYPSQWKIALIIPIPKKAKVSSLKDIRPISIYPIFSKIFEHLIKPQMDSFIDKHNLLSPFQSGFRPDYGVIPTLVDISSDTKWSLDNKEVMISVQLDYTRAFEMVIYICLLQKMQLLFRFSKLACLFFSSFLHGRSQIVKYNNHFSKRQTITRGLPQGSVLSPLLYSIFSNDLTRVIKHCSARAYADDTQLKISGPRSSINLLIMKLNEDLNAVNAWSAQNGLVLNPTKSQAIYFARNPIPNMPQPSIGDTPIEYFDVLMNLGVKFDRALTMEAHINLICSRIYFGLRKFYQIKRFIPTNLRLNLIKTYVLPFLYHGDVIYFSARKQFILKLERALNACTRFVFGLKRFDSISGVKNSLLGHSLENHLKIRVCLFLFKLLKTRKPPYLFESMQLSRSQRTRHLILPSFKSNHYSSSIFVAGARIWNTIPVEIRSVSNVNNFRSLIDKYFNN